MKTRIVTLYSKPNCQPCRATKRWLDKNGVFYTEKDVTQDPMDAAAVRELGYTGVPVLLVSTGDPETEIHWQGFHPDNLKKYVHTTQKAA